VVGPADQCLNLGVADQVRLLRLRGHAAAT
jgi:hypothetical protein